MRGLDADALALALLLAPVDERTRQRALSVLALRARVARGDECPSCRGREGIEDNGARGSEREYLCPCGHRWDEVEHG